jgi:hypothetical protein
MESASRKQTNMETDSIQEVFVIADFGIFLRYLSTGV